MKAFKAGILAIGVFCILIANQNSLAQSNKPANGARAKEAPGMTFSYRFRAWLNEPMAWSEIKNQRYKKPFIDKLNKWLAIPAQWPEIKKPNPDAYNATYIERFKVWWQETKSWQELGTRRFDESFIERFKNWWDLPQTWLDPLESKISEPVV